MSERYTQKSEGKAGVALTFDLEVTLPNMDEVEKLQNLIIRLFEYEQLGAVEECAELMKAKKENRILPEGSWYSESEEHK